MESGTAPLLAMRANKSEAAHKSASVESPSRRGVELGRAEMDRHPVPREVASF